MTAELSGPSVQLQSGIYIDLMDPDCSEVSIHDIAHALSNICRFTGHSKFFYSVAQHCVLCHDNAPPELRWHALMHDAAEALIGDVARPLKQLLPEYKQIERRVERSLLYKRYGVVDMPQEVKALDRQALATERRDLMPMTGERWGLLNGVEPFKERIQPKIPFVARAAFVNRAKKCCPEGVWL